MPHPVNPALEIRGQMAVARSLSRFDGQAAGALASDAIKTMLTALFQAQHSFFAENWPILTDPVLARVYREGACLLQRKTALCERLALATAKNAQDKEAKARALQQSLQEEPSAQTLLRRLQMGHTVRLNQHTLGFDADFQGLAGTNPYGIDYYAGNMTLENVTHWRTAMLSGQTWGASPVPEWETAGGDHQSDAMRELGLAIQQVETEFFELAGVNGVSESKGKGGFPLASHLPSQPFAVA